MPKKKPLLFEAASLSLVLINHEEKCNLTLVRVIKLTNIFTLVNNSSVNRINSYCVIIFINIYSARCRIRYLQMTLILLGVMLSESQENQSLCNNHRCNRLGLLSNP